MKDKAKQVAKNNKGNIFLLFIMAVAGLVAFFYGLPAVMTTDWNNSTQAWTSIAKMGIPSAIGVGIAYYYLKGVINTSVLIVRKFLFWGSIAAFSILWNPLPFKSSYVDLLKDFTYNKTDGSDNLFIALGIFLLAASIIVFHRVTRLLKGIGMIIAFLVIVASGWLAFNAGFMGLDITDPQTYKLAAFLAGWELLLIGFFWAQVSRAFNTRGAEDADTTDDDYND